MKKVLIFLILLIAIVVAIAYSPAIPVDELKATYTDEASAFVEIDGMDVHYRKTGQGFPVLLVHGTSASLHTWHAWHDHLSENFTVYSVDLPGCGITGPHPDDDYSIAAFLDFLETFTQAVGLDSFHIAGNSLGGHIAWEYARVNSKIKSAVLVDPSGFYLPDRDVPLVFRLGKIKVFQVLVEKLNVRPLIAKSLKEVYYNDELVTGELVQRYSDLIRRKGNRTAFIKKTGLSEQSPESELSEITCPVLIQWGREDLWIPLSLADVFTTHIPDNRLIVYDECGHIPQEEIPERSAQDALDFLISVEQADTSTNIEVLDQEAS